MTVKLIKSVCVAGLVAGILSALACGGVPPGGPVSSSESTKPVPATIPGPRTEADPASEPVADVGPTRVTDAGERSFLVARIAELRQAKDKASMPSDWSGSLKQFRANPRTSGPAKRVALLLVLLPGEYAESDGEESEWTQRSWDGIDELMREQD